VTDRKSDDPRGDEVDQRDEADDQKALDQARGSRWRRHLTEPAERRADLLGTRAWRTDHTEIALITTDDSREDEVYLRVTDVRTGNFVQAPLAPDDLEVVAHMLQLRAMGIRKHLDRR